MLRKAYISPEFEWLEIEIPTDALSMSVPPVNVDTNPADSGFEDETDPPNPGPGHGGDDIDDF